MNLIWIKSNKYIYLLLLFLKTDIPPSAAWTSRCVSDKAYRICVCVCIFLCVFVWVCGWIYPLLAISETPNSSTDIHTLTNKPTHTHTLSSKTHSLFYCLSVCSCIILISKLELLQFQLFQIVQIWF